jgi:hypothetical protein
VTVARLVRSSRLFLLAALVAAGSTAFAPRAVLAQPSEYEATIERAIGEFDARRWAEARTLFRRAHALEPNARTLRAIGMCSFELRDYVTAVLAFEDALVDTRRPLNETQRAEVERLLADARTFVATYEVALSPATATVVVDGAPAVVRDGVLLLNPGPHDVRVSADGFEPDVLRLEARGGPAGTVTIRLRLWGQDTTEHVRVPDPSTAPSTRAAQADAGEEAPRRGLAVAGWTSLGAGVAMGAAALGAGLRSHAMYQDLVDHCPCPERGADIDRGQALGRASTALTFVGAAAGVAGTVLLVVRRVGARAEDGEDMTAREPRLGVSGGPGELGAGLVVRF